MEYNWKELAKQYQEQALFDLKEILRFPSVLDQYQPNTDAPFGVANKQCLEKMLEIGARDGFIVKNIDSYAGHIVYGAGKESIGVLGHLDVVPATGTWTNHPFNPTIIDGKLFARGALDDKGPVMASYYALKMLKDLNVEMNKEVKLIVGSDEETGSRCLNRYFEKETMPDYGFSPDADFPLIYGEKALFSYHVEGQVDTDHIVSFDCGDRYNLVPDVAAVTIKNLDGNIVQSYIAETGIQAEQKGNQLLFYGKSAHAMQPHVGVNAGYLAMQFLNKYYPSNLTNFITTYFDTTGKKLGVAHHDPMMKDLTMNLAFIKIKDNQVIVGFNCRLPVNELKEKIETRLAEVLQTYHLSYKFISFSERHFVDPKSDFVQTLLKSYRAITGDMESQPYTIGGGTYARMMKTAVAFGSMFPNREDVVHQPNEYILIDDFVDWIAIYAKAIYDLTR